MNRLLTEVRTARQVTHSNVCRIYDVGETAPSTGSQHGEHFISMEYVDGEDLSSLLRRIGRLPKDKALQIARQICAGLQAAHDQGILHRDLKPANVMIDGRGRSKITDFGLAGLEETFQDGEIRSGTPAYMAPEQLEGKEVTVRSDIYALGLVLYELFTGKPAFEAPSPTEMGQVDGDTTPSKPSSHVEGLDSAVEQAILRCLEEDPCDRPPSALAVAVSLPGSDPLAAALAAGETPSPEMVADAGAATGFPAWSATAYLTLVLGGILVAAFLFGKYSLIGLVPLGKPPAVLVDTAREIVAEVGYTETPADWSYGFRTDHAYLETLSETDSSADVWDRLTTERPTAMQFWYRQSPQALQALAPNGRVGFRDPPLAVAGMVNLRLDTSGNLEFFLAVWPRSEPPHAIGSDAPKGDAPWSILFERAGLERSAFEEVLPESNPEVFCDDRRAWRGAYPDQPDSEVRVEACSLSSRPVSFELLSVTGGNTAQDAMASRSTTSERDILWSVLFVFVLLGALVLVRRNLRLGRGDRKGAFRLAACVSVLGVLSWALLADHVPDPSRELELFWLALGQSLLTGFQIWLLYLALEPFIRRHWPTLLTSWTRLLAGKMRDPIVGRDFLRGAAVGVLISVTVNVGNLAPGWLGLRPETPLALTAPDSLLGGRWLAGRLVSQFSDLAWNALWFVFFVVLLRVALRRTWLAVMLFLLIMLPWHLGAEHLVISLFAGLLFWGLILIAILRFGLLATAVSYFYSWLAVHFPLTLDFSAWHGGTSILLMLIAGGAAVYAFYLSLAGRLLIDSRAMDG